MMLLHFEEPFSSGRPGISDTAVSIAAQDLLVAATAEPELGVEAVKFRPSGGGSAGKH
jgi:hypothetical protein